MGSDDEIIPVVNELDEIIGYKPRKEITYDDIYRVSACWIIDTSGNILLAQRGLNKKHHPGKRGPAVAGTVTKDQSYLQNILEEIEEEVGISVTEQDISEQVKTFKQIDRSHFTQTYLLVYSGDKSLLRPESGDVEQLKRFTPHELEDALEKTPDLFLGAVHSMFQQVKQ